MNEGEKPPYPRTGPIREAINQMRVLRGHHSRLEKETTWGMYAASMGEYYWHFGHYFYPEDEVYPDKVKEWKARTGKPAVVVDVAGLADGKDIGADQTINIALEDPLNRKAEESASRKIILGDITSTAVQRKTLETIDAAPARPILIVFRAGMALRGSIPGNSVIELRLLDFFEDLYQRMDPEGEFLVDITLWPKETWKRLEEFLESFSIPYDVPVKESRRGGVYRINKGAGA